MSKSIGKFIFFAAGLVLGSAVTWRVAKEKYERIAQEEIDSVKAVFSKRIQKTDEETHRVEYEKKVETLGYAPSAINFEEKGEAVAMDRPYVIPPDEFDENDYATISLTYFADGVVVDDCGDVVNDLDSTIGRDSLTHFGEYEDDSVFVRNDKLQIDYEILFDPRKYSDVKEDAWLETASWE